MKPQTYKWEVTDTFCGEANYSWVRRGSVTMPEIRDGESITKHNTRIARAIKKAAGLNGIHGRSYWHGDEYEFRPYRACVVLFASYNDE